jgi:hypothetical protein
MNAHTPSAGRPVAAALRRAPAPRAPTIARRLVRAVARFVSGGTIAVAGLLAGAVVYGLTESWLSPGARVDLSLGVSIAIWFTAGMGWLRPRKWPRLIVVFGVSLGVGILVSIAVTGYLRWMGIPL